MATNGIAPQSAERKLLDPSKLGTKDYWDDIYTRELGNHQDDTNDEGTVWFEESNAEAAVLDQLNLLAEQGHLRRSDDENARASRFLDLGTGNGHMLFALREEDDEGQSWSGDGVGVDYSEASVQLARRIAAERHRAFDGGDDSEESLANEMPIRFESWDLLTSSPGDWLGDGFEVVLDKGTFDAISLMVPPESGPHPCEVYRDHVIPLIKPGYFLFVTSCNWTKTELVDWLALSGSALELFGEAKYPTFTFGGRTGQSIVTVIFRKT